MLYWTGCREILCRMLHIVKISRCAERWCSHSRVLTYIVSGNWVAQYTKYAEISSSNSRNVRFSNLLCRKLVTFSTKFMIYAVRKSVALNCNAMITIKQKLFWPKILTMYYSKWIFTIFFLFFIHMCTLFWYDATFFRYCFKFFFVLSGFIWNWSFRDFWSSEVHTQLQSSITDLWGTECIRNEVLFAFVIKQKWDKLYIFCHL